MHVDLDEEASWNLRVLKQTPGLTVTDECSMRTHLKSSAPHGNPKALNSISSGHVHRPLRRP